MSWRYCVPKPWSSHEPQKTFGFNLVRTIWIASLLPNLPRIMKLTNAKEKTCKGCRPPLLLILIFLHFQHFIFSPSPSLHLFPLYLSIYLICRWAWEIAILYRDKCTMILFEKKKQKNIKSVLCDFPSTCTSYAASHKNECWESALDKKVEESASSPFLN